MADYHSRPRDLHGVVLNLHQVPNLAHNSTETVADLLMTLNAVGLRWSDAKPEDRDNQGLLAIIAECQRMVDVWPEPPEAPAGDAGDWSAPDFERELIYLGQFLTRAHETALWASAGLTGYDYETGSFNLTEEHLKEIE